MEEVKYIGELLWPGVVGHLAIILSFVAALAGSYAYFRAMKSDDRRWTRLGGAYYIIHGFAVLLVIGLIIFLMANERYEYKYVWEHVSADLPTRYIFSAFWEGQEGSFLLWAFWHVVLGAFLVRSKGTWKAPVMGVLLAVQAVICSMLLGIYITENFKLGINPFPLLRDTMQAPIFARADYLSMIDGSGLSPLLQNYWMTIHPPTLFLGFASVTIPFGFALGGLISGKHREWLKPALPWALFSAGILGTGILMGSAWAYEALTFGGYWAWDPVENMSLVPWIILLAGIHSNLIARRSGYSLRATYAFYLLAFILVLYSTFLTRSGVLGDTSAHAFTQMGLEWQLVGFIAIFAISSLWLLLRNWKRIPMPEKEEKLVSREFWMFIGTLVLLFSAILISFTTSIPVWNKILDFFAGITGSDLSDLHRTAPVEPIPHYNRFQLWIAICIALLSGIAQFLRYREPRWDSNRSRFLRSTLISLAGGLGLTIVLSLWIEVYAWQYWLLMGCGAFAIIANALYLVQYAKGNLSQTASGVAHFGFAVMVIGILASGLNQRTISTNPFAQTGLVDGLDPQKYVTLIKERPTFMNGYWVEYVKDTIEGNSRIFTVLYTRLNAEMDTVETFTLHPDVLFNNKLTKVEASNPATKHYLSHDIFTYVAALPGEQMDIEAARQINDTLNFRELRLTPTDTFSNTKFALWLEDVNLDPDTDDYTRVPGDLPVQVDIGIHDFATEKKYYEEVLLYLRDGLLYGYPAQINDLNLRIRLSDRVIGSIYRPEDSLEYRQVALQQGQSAALDRFSVTLTGIDREVNHPQYVPKERDIAINAILRFDDGTHSYTLRPLYFIRDGQQNNIKAFVPQAGIYARFERVDPKTETFYFRIALDPGSIGGIPLEIADNVPRNDIIVLEAILFPGINLFWTGAILMMAGLFLGMWSKRSKRNSA